MNDRALYRSPAPTDSPGHVPAEELLFTFDRDCHAYRCELHHQGTGAVEALFFKNDEFVLGRRFASREYAIEWACARLTAIVMTVR